MDLDANPRGWVQGAPSNIFMLLQRTGQILMNTNNNRQQNNNNNNRRRGRSNNNNRQQNNNRSGFDYNNSIDNRARGNAAQMLEKYKKMAQDAQFIGDRVNAEYHLQFADHYFRVLADFRGRQEARQEQQGERRPPRDENRDDNRDDWREQSSESGYEDIDNGEQAERSSESEGASEDREERPRRESREDRPRRNDRNERGNRDRDGNRPPRRHHSEEADDEAVGLDLAVLPPSIALANDDDVEVEAAKPARKPRARRPKSANDEETVTAAE
jgi:Domain of unknown function (DUF4167)